MALILTGMEELLFLQAVLVGFGLLASRLCANWPNKDLRFVTVVGKIDGLFSPRPRQMFWAASLMFRRAKILGLNDLPLKNRGQDLEGYVFQPLCEVGSRIGLMADFGKGGLEDKSCTRPRFWIGEV